MSRDRPGRLLEDEPECIGRPFVTGYPLEPVAQSEPEPGPASAIEEALLNGYNEGLERAQNELNEQIEAFRTAVRESLQKISDYEREFASAHEANLLELVAQTASRIARARIEQGDDLVQRALQESLQALPDSTPVRARMHPDDVAALENSSEVDSSRVDLVADEGISRGGLILESDFGRVDATIETAEDAAREAVLGTRELR